MTTWKPAVHISKGLVTGCNMARRTVDKWSFHWEQVTCKRCLKNRPVWKDVDVNSDEKTG